MAGRTRRAESPRKEKMNRQELLEALVKLSKERDRLRTENARLREINNNLSKDIEFLKKQIETLNASLAVCESFEKALKTGKN